ncbi:hypothetical protein Tco_0729556 [Tanacetum coccineum]|uniref:Eukaryotic translation initiation factor 3 subunit G N-terminal domain-containing protein n=1 Tax=Tanacetum coccineum TaxID=301880 RepID=A0ABQ4YRN1_9ASTR
MAEPTMEEYMMKTREDYGSGIARPKIDEKAHFELKGQFLKELRDKTFSGSDSDDANEYIRKVLEIVDQFYIPDVTQDQVMLQVFPMLLTGTATRWLRNEPVGSIDTWETLKKKEVILFYKGLDVPTRHILDSKAAIQAQLNNIGREIKKVIERVYVAQVRCELCNGPHYTKDCPLKEDGKTFEEAHYTQFGVPFPQGGRYREAAPGFYQRDHGNTSYQE